MRLLQNVRKRVEKFYSWNDIDSYDKKFGNKSDSTSYNTSNRKQPSCKKCAEPKLLWNTKWWLKNDCVKILNNHNLGEFALPSPCLTRIGHQIHLNCHY